MTAQPVISVRGLQKSYGEFQAVRGISDACRALARVLHEQRPHPGPDQVA